ncbi:MarR family winged helix-turn-helix transcriptional regulator [Aquibium sp. ELW1220]|uniref:MarR family winged helix-turn-helix transcriptional regulator n=1 Tax=Aquibium sp. ELW1220 TaxID=2976766 RepID=UPI0025B25650|nr:MarR family winged helix-turn-helix transcriptional regulator [Aquibium sp. ELW1220]MDN2578442.1 MarR family winged helix-turn-helix transcriptional regulator [Aquibium sp. ELW1220]
MHEDEDEARLLNVFGAMSLACVDKMEKALASHGGRSPSATAALIRIGTGPGLSIEQLRRMLALSHSATVRLVDQLVAQGLVLRAGAAGRDKRARALALTDEGEAAVRQSLAARRAVLARATEGLTNEERRLLSALVDKILPALVDAGDDSDVVCRICDEGVCVPARCPIPHHGSPAP